MSGKRIVVTGAAGFIGSHLVRELTGRGHQLLALDRVGSSGFPPGTTVVKSDILEADWDGIMNWEPDVLVHLAGTARAGASFHNIQDEVRDSVLLTAALMDRWKERPPMKFLFVSSAGVYGDQMLPRYDEDLRLFPLSPYAVCKCASEDLLRVTADTYGLDYAVARPFSIYGPGLKKQVIYDLTRRFLQGENPLVIAGTGREERDFVHIEDCCRAISRMIDRDEWGGMTVNVGTGVATSLDRLAVLLREHTGYQGTYSFSGQDFPGNPLRLVANTTRIDELGLSSAIKLEDGVAGVVAFVRDCLGDQG